MASLKSIVLPPPAPTKPASTPKDAHETVFYPQTHDSFNLDHYNGSRPSFAFAGIHGATSTPVSKQPPFPLFSEQITEECGGGGGGGGDDSVFERTDFVTAMESPVLQNDVMKKALEAQKAKEMEEKREKAAPKFDFSAGIGGSIQDSKAKAQKGNEAFRETDLQKAVLGEYNAAQNYRENSPKSSDPAAPKFGFFADIGGSIQDPKASEKSENMGKFGSETSPKSPAAEATRLAPNFDFSAGSGSGSIHDSKASPSEKSGRFGATTTGNSQKSSIFGGNLPPNEPGFFGVKPPGNAPKQAEIPAKTTGKPSIFGANSPQTSGFFGVKPTENAPENAEIPAKTTGKSPIFGAKLPPNEQKLSTIFGGSSPKTTGFLRVKPAENAPENAEIPAKTTGKPPIFDEKPPEKAQKPSVRPYILFKNYIGLLKTLADDKKSFESSADPHFRALLKRTITEKVTVFTQRQTSPESRAEILEFFKNLLQKQKVHGFAVIGSAPVLELKTDDDVNYAVFCIVEKYISLAELDEELAPTISDLISRLSVAHRRVEKVFIVLMFNKSTLLRQNPEECLSKFMEHTTAENSDAVAIEWNQEKALVTLFFTVFAKNATIASKGYKMVLNDDLLWKYVKMSVDHVLEIPKASFILLQLITTCKPRLHTDYARWNEMLGSIQNAIIPELESNSFEGDEAIVSQLAQMAAVLQQ